MNPFIEETIHWGILHTTLKYNYKNYTNITFLDDKFNLCDFLDDIIKQKCPIHPGIYHINIPSAIPKLFWPVSNRYSVSLLLFYFIGSVLWKSNYLQ